MLRARIFLAVLAIVGCANRSESSSSAAPVASEVRTIPSAPSVVVASASASASAAPPNDEFKGCILKVPAGTITVASAIGAAKVPGADAVIAQNRWRLKACYEKTLEFDPKAQGAATLAFDVTESGAVGKCAVKAPPALPARLASCLEAAGAKMKFSSPSGGTTFTVAVAFKLNP